MKFLKTWLSLSLRPSALGYVAGLILCNIKSSDYIVQRLDINSYILFGPVFFVNIGVGMMTRGEVALIVSQKGLAVGLMDVIITWPLRQETRRTGVIRNENTEFYRPFEYSQ